MSWLETSMAILELIQKTFKMGMEIIAMKLGM